MERVIKSVLKKNGTADLIQSSFDDKNCAQKNTVNSYTGTYRLGPVGSDGKRKIQFYWDQTRTDFYGNAAYLSRSAPKGWQSLGSDGNDQIASSYLLPEIPTKVDGEPINTMDIRAYDSYLSINYGKMGLTFVAKDAARPAQTVLLDQAK